MATLTLSAPTGASSVTITGEAQVIVKNISITLPTGLIADPSNPSSITAGTSNVLRFTYNPMNYIFNLSNFNQGMRDLGDYGQPTTTLNYNSSTGLVTVTYTVTPYFSDTNPLVCNVSSSLYALTFNTTGINVEFESISIVSSVAVATYSVTAQTGYNLPSTITVTGCTHTWRTS